MNEIKVHKLLESFPKMTEEALNNLSEDIKKNGLNNPIIMIDDVLIDGRNRLKACQMAGVEPTFCQYTGNRDEFSILSFVISQNMQRNDISATQKACLAAKFMPMFSEQAKERKINANPSGLPHVALVPHGGDSGKSRDFASSAFGVGQKYVQFCWNCLRDRPDLFNQMLNGEREVSDIQKLLREEKTLKEINEALLKAEAKKEADRIASEEAKRLANELAEKYAVELQKQKEAKRILDEQKAIENKKLFEEFEKKKTELKLIEDESKRELERINLEKKIEDDRIKSIKLEEKRIAFEKEKNRIELEKINSAKEAARLAEEIRIRNLNRFSITEKQEVVQCDALITDPPYGILNVEWDMVEIESFTRDWLNRWNECGADLFYSFFSQKYMWEGKKWFDESLTNYNFQQLLVWRYNNNFNGNNNVKAKNEDRNGYKHSWEPIFFYRKKGSKKIIKPNVEEWGGETFRDIDSHNAPVPLKLEKGANGGIHPTQKPLSAMLWLVSTSTMIGDLVCDPFCGSGTTGLASIQLNRRFYGIETDSDMKQKANDRILLYGDEGIDKYTKGYKENES